MGLHYLYKAVDAEPLAHHMSMTDISINPQSKRILRNRSTAELLPSKCGHAGIAYKPSLSCEINEVAILALSQHCVCNRP